MGFQDYKYERPDLDRMSAEWANELTAFKTADTLEEQIRAVDRLAGIQKYFRTMMTLVSIRYSTDTRDEYYQEEQAYVDQTVPVLQSLLSAFYQALLKSKFRRGLEERFGTQIFRLAEMQDRSFSEEIIPELQEENRLSSSYGKLIASAQIEFDGKILTLAQIDPYIQDPDRAVREAATRAKFAFFEGNEAAFDTIFDDLVQVRTRMAEKLGFGSYVELAYMRMSRSDYDAGDVALYRKQVKDEIVPLYVKLRERQAERLGLDTVKFFDEGFHFRDGNAKPVGDAELLLGKAREMYHELSAETAVFIDHMIAESAMDLEAKPGKQSGGYCTYISDYETPFIFANFNGTSDDVDTLTHEAGHAFQCWESGRRVALPEYIFPGMEAGEIHSMSMEFFTWPWMDGFFGEKADRYRFMHLASSILFIPYGVTVDEFQHWVYENPSASPAERKAKWRELEGVYLSSRDYDGIDYLERGGLWMRQAHIYSSPFYYIDYALARVLALQFWVSDHVEGRHEEAWERFLLLCRKGGSLPFLELVKSADLLNPFEKGTIVTILPAVERWLDQVDDTKI